MKKLRFTISPLGEVQLDVEGAVGGECDSLSAPFESALGTVSNKSRKDSYFVEATTQQVPVTRIFIQKDGDMVVTDLWDSVRPMVGLSDEDGSL